MQTTLLHCHLTHQRRYILPKTTLSLHVSHRLSSIRILSYYSNNPHRPPPRHPFRRRTSPEGNVYEFFPRRSSRFLGALCAGSMLLFTKSKYVVGALKLTKLSTLGSMLLTVGAYTTIFGLPYAAGMVGLILVHESGHALAMKHYNVPYSPMVFIPFFGAAVAMKKQPKSAYEEAMIALGGPVLGSLGAGAVFGSACLTNSSLLYALADFGYIVNLFNLLPLGMMDGGRICQALSPYAGLVGLGIGGTFFFNGTIQNPIFGVIMLAGGWETVNRLWFYWKGTVPVAVPRYYYKITKDEQAKIIIGYTGLIGSLLAAMALNEGYKKNPRRLNWEKNYGNDGKLQNYYRDY